MFARMDNKLPKINFTDRSNGVQVRYGALGMEHGAVRCRAYPMNSRILSDILSSCMVINTHGA